MTVPAALPAPALLTGPGALEGTQEAPATDAFAVLLAALAGGVAVPVAAPPVAPVPQRVDPAGTPTAAVTGAAAPGPVPPGPTPVGATAVGSPVAWEAATQRALVPPAELAAGSSTPAPESGLAAVAGVPRALVAPVEEAVSVPVGLPVEVVEDPGPAAARGGHRAAVEPLPAELQVGPVVPTGVAAPAVPLDGPVGAVADSATDTAAPTSTHRVQPALVEAARGLRDEGGGRTSLVVRLDPPELGAVVVRLTVQDGRVDVQLRTPDVTARADLQAQSLDVQRVLRENGLDLASFDTSFDTSFGTSSDASQGGLLSGGSDDARTPDRGTPQRSGAADGRTGTSLVTDDVTDPQAAGTWL